MNHTLPSVADVFAFARDHKIHTYEDCPLSMAFYLDISIEGGQIIEQPSGIAYGYADTYKPGTQHRMLPVEMIKRIQDASAYTGFETCCDFIYEPLALCEALHKHKYVIATRNAGEIRTYHERPLRKEVEAMVGEMFTRLNVQQHTNRIVEAVEQADGPNVHCMTFRNSDKDAVGFNMSWVEGGVAFTAIRVVTEQFRIHSRWMLWETVKQLVGEHSVSSINDGSAMSTPGLFRFKRDLCPAFELRPYCLTVDNLGGLVP